MSNLPSRASDGGPNSLPDCPRCGARNWNIRSYCYKCEDSGCNCCMNVREDGSLICKGCVHEDLQLGVDCDDDTEWDGATIWVVSVKRYGLVVSNADSFHGNQSLDAWNVTSAGAVFVGTIHIQSVDIASNTLWLAAAPPAGIVTNTVLLVTAPGSLPELKPITSRPVVPDIQEWKKYIQEWKK